MTGSPFVAVKFQLLIQFFAVALLGFASSDLAVAETQRERQIRLMTAERLAEKAAKLGRAKAEAEDFIDNLRRIQFLEFEAALNQGVQQELLYAIETHSTLERLANQEFDGLEAIETKPSSNLEYETNLLPCLLALVDRKIAISRSTIEATSRRLRQSDVKSINLELASMFQTIRKNEFQAPLLNGCDVTPVAGSDPSNPASVTFDGKCFANESIRKDGTTPLTHPTVASILHDDGRSGRSAFCSGTLVAPNAVLTAAHCFCDTRAKDARSGRLFHSFRSCRTGQYRRMDKLVFALDPTHHSVFFQHVGVVQIKKVIIHRSYRVKHLPEADLALLILKRNIEGIKPTPINTAWATPPNTIGTIVGYGHYTPIGKDGVPRRTFEIVQNTGLKLIAPIRTGRCRYIQRVRRMICWRYQPEVAGMKLGSTCHGDSGGPLFVKIKKILHLAGITAAGGKNCQPGSPTYDFDVFQFRRWIRGHLNDNPPAISTKPAPRHINQLGCKFCESCDTDPKSVGTKIAFAIPQKNANRLLITMNCTIGSEPYELLLKPVKNTPKKCGAKSVSAVRQCPETVVSPEQKFEIEINGAASRECQVLATTYVR